MIRCKAHCCRRCRHQEGGRNTFSGYISDNDLSGPRVDRKIVVVIATYTPRGVHHSGYFESRNSWFSREKKQALNLSPQVYIPQEVITLLPNRPRKRFPLVHIP